MDRRRALAACLAPLAACAYANGYDPSRYAVAAASCVDPEVEPLPPSTPVRLRDPRGVRIFDAGVPMSHMVELTSAGETDAAPLRPVSPSPEPHVVAATAASVVAPAPSACGSKGDPCPLQRFMHGAMATAHTPDALTAAFTRVAGMSPDAAWTWVAIATRGADLANAGDVAGAKAQCQACHDAYREPYRTKHRARPL